jgi:uncharacterized protein
MTPVTDLLLGAFALVLVLEGLMPLFSPKGWRKAFERAVQMSDGQIRFVGMICLVSGVLLLALWF